MTLSHPRSVALGYDEGTVLIKVGREEPVASMDTGGKIIWARHNEIQTVNVKSLGDIEECPLAQPSIGVSMLRVQHSHNLVN